VKPVKVDINSMAYIANQLKEIKITIDAGQKLKVKGTKACAAYCKKKGYNCNDWTIGTK
jgi:hypothetical protein